MNLLHLGVAAAVGLVLLALLALFVAALVSIVRSPAPGTTGKVVWILVVVVFPFVGPLAWFLFGRRLRPRT